MTQSVAIIGGGVIGLHASLFFRERGFETYLLEREARPGHHTSSRNSGVIHAGIYYQQDSLKEKLCLQGNALTYEWLARLGVDHRRTGKWVIPALLQDESVLQDFYQKLKRLRLEGMEWLTPADLQKREPALKETSAIHVPTTGVMDAAAYIQALARQASIQGVNLLCHCEVTGMNGLELETSRGPLQTDLYVNAAGLRAGQIASLAGLEGYEVRPCRGDYYEYDSLPISKPVYHPPSPGGLGLGIHLTPTADGAHLLLGPNAYFIDEPEDYHHRSQPQDYVKTLQDHLPRLAHYRIRKAYAGNRPKLFRQGQACSDFAIIAQGRWIHALGIESPGLTAAPAIAQFLGASVGLQ